MSPQSWLLLGSRVLRNDQLLADGRGEDAGEPWECRLSAATRRCLDPHVTPSLPSSCSLDFGMSPLAVLHASITTTNRYYGNGL
jgi:hypothetical protein